MANIHVHDIKPAGIELFGDSESFMNQLSDDEITAIIGGERIPLYSTESGTVKISYIETTDILK